MHHAAISLLKNLKAVFTPAPRAAPAECIARLHEGKALLIDVREPGEWAGGVARDAVLLPLSDLTGARTLWGRFLANAAGRELLLYCTSGTRSGMAARLLTAEGFRAVNAGGLAEWAAAGWRIEKRA